MIEVYLDYNGSSPLDPRVGKAMWPALAEWYGNASSTHRFGRRQAAAVEDARAQRDAGEEVLDDELVRLTELTGSPARAQQILLALLGERLLPASEQDAPTEERRQHG